MAPRHLHPVTFYDRDKPMDPEEGRADFRAYYERVPRAVVDGPNVDAERVLEQRMQERVPAPPLPPDPAETALTPAGVFSDPLAPEDEGMKAERERLAKLAADEAAEQEEADAEGDTRTTVADDLADQGLDKKPKETGTAPGLAGSTKKAGPAKS